MSALPSLHISARARLPAAYEAAKTALAECSRIDECEQWKDKAVALASYARQANDTALLEYASRIKNRAVRRLGELSRTVETAERRRTDLHPTGGKQTKLETLKAAGVSTSAAHRAELVAEIPAEEFERLVESPAPPSVTELARLGAARKRESFGAPAPQAAEPPLTTEDIEARKALGQLMSFAAFCRTHDNPRELARHIPDDRVANARAAVTTLDTWLDSFVTNLRSY